MSSSFVRTIFSFLIFGRRCCAAATRWRRATSTASAPTTRSRRLTDRQSDQLRATTLRAVHHGNQELFTVDQICHGGADRGPKGHLVDDRSGLLIDEAQIIAAFDQ